MSPEAATESRSRFDLSAGPVARRLPPRIIVYGEPGVGKTTFGCSAPDPVLIATEDGADGIEIARLPNEGKCESWGDLIEALNVLKQGEHQFKTVVIDTLNGAEKLCAQMICGRDFGGVWHSERGREGYNAWAKGAKATAQDMAQMLNLLDELRNKRGMQVILLAHAGLHRSGNALGEDFQKFAPDVDKYAWSAIHGWSDMIGHAAREVRVAKDDSGRAKARAVGQERYIYWEGGPGRDAKSRVGYEMPQRTLLSYDDVSRALSTDWKGELVKEILELFPRMPDEVRGKMSAWLGEVNDARLRQLDKIKLETITNRMLANLPQNQDEEIE